MLRDHIYYEWTVEHVDPEYEDILSVEFWNTADEAIRSASLPSHCVTEDGVVCRVDIGVIRSKGNQDDGLKHRAYAYVEDGKLPGQFDDGHVVPKLFQKELDQAYERRNK